MAIVGRDSFGAKRKVKNSINAQNAAFVGALRHAKNHVNINSPNLNSFDLMDEIFFAVKRGVDVNFFFQKTTKIIIGGLKKLVKISCKTSFRISIACEKRNLLVISTFVGLSQEETL